MMCSIEVESVASITCSKTYMVRSIIPVYATRYILPVVARLTNDSRSKKCSGWVIDDLHCPAVTSIAHLGALRVCYFCPPSQKKTEKTAKLAHYVVHLGHLDLIVCVCVCLFINMHITAQSGPVIYSLYAAA